MSLILSIPFNNSVRNFGLQKNTITSVPSVTPSYIAGPVNNALSFNGSTYWKSQGITLGTEATICCWSKTGTNSRMSWVLESDGYAYLNLFESGIYTLNAGDSNNNPFKTTSNANINVLHDNAWHHFAVTFGSGVAKLYIDGTYRGTSVTFRSPKTTNKTIKIGGGFGNGHSYDWNGGIADFRVYDHCLIESDIQRIYNGDTKMLQVFLPFHKDCRNVGLENVKTTSAGTFQIASDTTSFKCAKFGTSTGYVKIPHDIFKKNTEMSMAFSINFNSWNTSYATPIGIFKNNNSWTGNTFTFLRINTSQKFSFSISDGTSSTQSNLSTPALSLGTWYHFACVYKNKKMYLYQDGNLLLTSNPSFGPSFTAATLAIVGASTTGGSYQTDCKMSNVRLYNLALTDEDVKRISKALPGEYQPINFLKFAPGQRINTGVLISSNNVVITNAVMYYETGGTGRDLMGWSTSAANYWGVTAGGAWEKAKATYSDITKESNVTYSCTASSVTNGQYQIGALSNTYSVRTKYIKSFQIIVNGTVQRDYYACYRKSDKKYGMYDIITRTFYTNAGSGGDFTGI